MPHTKEMFDWFAAFGIPLFRDERVKSMLYVGWRHDCKPWWYDHMAKALGVTRVGVLEIFPKNITDLEQEVWNGRYECEVIKGDARDPGKSIKPGEWDLIFWDHGPEHVSQEDLKVATEQLYAHAGRALVYCCPWGDWPQGEEDGNPHEVHRNTITDEKLREVGFNTDLCVIHFGQPGQASAGEVAAWRIK